VTLAQGQAPFIPFFYRKIPAKSPPAIFFKIKKQKKEAKNTKMN